MEASISDVEILQRNLRECMGRGVRALIDSAKAKGLFPAYIDELRQNEIPHQNEVLQGYAAWTTAEGILALIITHPWIHEFDTPTDYDDIQLDFLVNATQNLLKIERNFEQQGIPAFPDLYIDDLQLKYRGVVDSTVKVIMALNAVRRYMIFKRWPIIHTHNGEIEIPIETINDAIDSLIKWLENEQDERGGWGIWKGAESRIYPTHFAITALLDCGKSKNDPHIKKAVKWLREWELSHKQTDIANTSFFVLGLSQAENLWSESVKRKVNDINYKLKNNCPTDVYTHINVPNYGNVPVTYPAKPRAICALLQSGESPLSPTILTLLDEIWTRELPKNGWAEEKKEKDAEPQTWYTYVVIDTIATWFTYIEELGLLPSYFWASKVEEPMRLQLEATLKQQKKYKFISAASLFFLIITLTIIYIIPNYSELYIYIGAFLSLFIAYIYPVLSSIVGNMLTPTFRRLFRKYPKR
jgi:hypothetical protein